MPGLRPGDSLPVIKLNTQQVELWRYDGRIISHSPEGILLEAYFNRPDDLLFHGIHMRRGDRFIEMYFFKRWFNIYEIYDKDSEELKAWYCNVTRPVEIFADALHYVDLALDLLVFPDGRMLELDEDEFLDLQLDPAEQDQARKAMKELREMFLRPGGVSLERDFKINSQT